MSDDHSPSLTGRRADQTAVAFDTYNQTVGDTVQTLRDPNGTFGDALPAVCAYGVHANQRGELRTSGLAGSLTGSRSGKQFEGVMTASALTSSMGHHGHSSPRGDGSDNLVAAFDIFNQSLSQEVPTLDTLGRHSVFGTLNSGGNSGGLRTEPGEHVIPVQYAEQHDRDERANGIGIGEPGDPSFSLECRQQHGVMAPQHGVRRLTPLECERLQGFPDTWTCLCGAPGTASCVCPDSPRYKQMGNAVTVPVIAWLARRLLAEAKRRAA